MDKLTKEKIMVLEWLEKVVFIKNWNPQDDKDATFGEWVEIMGNMSEDELNGFVSYIDDILIKEKGYIAKRDYLTNTLPSTRWKALIQVLEEK